MKLLTVVVLISTAIVSETRNSGSSSASSSSSSHGDSGTGSDSGSLSSNAKAVSIRGEVFCGNASTKASKVIVKLFNTDTDNTPMLLLNSDVNTDRGTFAVEGNTRYAMFQPILAIYHNCAYEDKEKLRRLLIKIPSSYVQEGRIATKIYDIGKWNLEPEYPNETHEEIDKLNNRFIKRLLMKMFF